MDVVRDEKSGLLYRPSTSDIKSIREVIYRNSYQKKGFFELESGDIWLDIGACIGAFSFLASKHSSSVISFEPYSVHYAILKENLSSCSNVTLKRIGLSTERGIKELHLNTARQNTWRNSIHKSWLGGSKELVRIEHIEDYIDKCNAIKLDAEGVEKEILLWMLANNKLPKKLVFEWSFDIHPSVEVFLQILTQLQLHYEVKIPGNLETYVSKLKAHKTYPANWFPACLTLYCIK